MYYDKELSQTIRIEEMKERLLMMGNQGTQELRGRTTHFLHIFFIGKVEMGFK